MTCCGLESYEVRRASLPLEIDEFHQVEGGLRYESIPIFIDIDSDRRLVVDISDRIEHPIDITE
jgi:hypothetical protein